MAPITRTQRRASASGAGPSKVASAPVQKLIIRDMSDESSSKENVPLIRRRRKIVPPPVANVDLNVTPMPSIKVSNAAKEEMRWQDQMAAEIDDEMEMSREREREQLKEGKDKRSEKLMRKSTDGQRSLKRSMKEKRGTKNKGRRRLKQLWKFMWKQRLKHWWKIRKKHQRSTRACRKRGRDIGGIGWA